MGAEGRFTSDVPDRVWEIAKILLGRGHRVLDVVRVYPVLTADALYSKNSREWHIPLKRSARRGVRCPVCNERKPVYRGLKCRSCFNAGNRKGRPRGKDHPQWKGGATDKAKLFRTSAPYKAWRKAVFDRDDYTCQECGVRGGDLQAHHERPFSQDPEGRLDVDNGVTLCKPCHKATDTYGNGAKSWIAADYLAGAER